MPGKTWKGASIESLARVREMLLKRGATEDKDLKNPYELWRVRIDRTVFTAYKTGSIYCNGARLLELTFLYASISPLLGQS